MEEYNNIGTDVYVHVHIRRCLFVFGRRGESEFSVNSCFFAVFSLGYFHNFSHFSHNQRHVYLTTITVFTQS